MAPKNEKLNKTPQEIDADIEGAYLQKIRSMGSDNSILSKRERAQVVHELNCEYQFPINRLIKVAGLSRSTYYYTRSKMNEPDPDFELKELTSSIYYEYEGCYGYRRIQKELENRGHKVNHKKVYRIMKELGFS
ncbi:hypothetical protein N780_14050 [Pontibacillus chungwhensis BH030062]|uniref:HTH-like domain-containing protein n=1 Tax=Pontibacillus chungwhensis BH030062 TaxID=1385513 RepID=A0A0A2UW44_9BACI|nr:IS3 family transposase [Pontibacillus chungwhensis]KGP92512.1 hypothetical protein N780_14050 [Pontibacillus chungwhensis BH030062]